MIPEDSLDNGPAARSLLQVDEFLDILLTQPYTLESSKQLRSASQVVEQDLSSKG